MTDPFRDIPPNPRRWQPNPEPASIVVPGLDTTAPVLDQIEQIEQLITIKLQNIDENFSKIQNLLASQLLPAVKRYAVGTEPVREAAQFWTSFYEQAAQVRIPAYDDYSSLNEQQSHLDDESANSTQPNSEPESVEQRYEPSITSTENSFMPGQAAYASTPATTTRHATFASTSATSARHTTFASTPATTRRPTPHHYSFVSQHPEKSSLWATPTSLDDSFDGLPPGMSPPVLMSPARPPRSAAELGLGKTPTRIAAERITQALISDVQRKSGGGLLARPKYGQGGASGAESSMSTVPTPPSLSRYTRQLSEDTEPDSFSDSDSMDEVHNTAHPSAAFLMASQGLRGASDDSFGSSNRSSDSLSEEDVVDALGPVHPFARGIAQSGDGFEDEDSFDDEMYEDGGPQEETLFGVPPAQRLQGRGGEGFRMLGEDLLQDTIGIGEQMARTGRVEESPTPFRG